MNEKKKQKRKKNNSGASYQLRAETKGGGGCSRITNCKKNR